MPHWIDAGIGVVVVAFAVAVYFRPPRGRPARLQHREVGVLRLPSVGLLMPTPAPLYLASPHGRAIVVIVAAGFGSHLVGSAVAHLV